MFYKQNVLSIRRASDKAAGGVCTHSPKRGDRSLARYTDSILDFSLTLYRMNLSRYPPRINTLLCSHYRFKRRRRADLVSGKTVTADTFFESDSEAALHRETMCCCGYSHLCSSTTPVLNPANKSKVKRSVRTPRRAM